IWWSACLVGAFFLARWMTRGRSSLPDWLEYFGWLMTIVAGKFLLIDTLAWRIYHGVTLAAVGANLQAAAGATVIAALIALAAGAIGEPPRVASVRRRMVMMAVVVLLWLTSLE